MGSQAFWKRVGLALALLILLVVPVVVRVNYYLHLLLLTFMYAAMATSWNIMGGYAGYISLGHSVFFGVGGYISALLAIHYGLSPLLTAPLAGLGAAIVGVFIGYTSLRTRGRAFVIVTIALLYIFQLIALNLRGLTRGVLGLQLPLPPWDVDIIKVPFYYAMLLIMCAAIYTSYRVRNSKFGLGLMAIREDEDKAEAVGINTSLYKILAFAISVYFVGVAGGVYGYYQTYIDPLLMFDIVVGVRMILMTILGGRGTLWGPVLGAFIALPAQDFILFRFGSSSLHLTFFGLFLLLLVLFLPQGILPSLREGLRYARRWRATLGFRISDFGFRISDWGSPKSEIRNPKWRGREEEDA
ncbi:MAG: branched-chain amino acid ABC transporter permease [Anaerolineae bacterium]